MQIASITTNEQGEYECTTEEDYLEQTLDIIIEKEGFERKNISYEIDRAEIKSDFLLNELEKGTKEKTRIFGTIRNSKNRDPVKAASITLSIEGTQIAAVYSNEQGKYEYTAEEDYTGQTLDYVIQKEGFIRKDISYEIERFEIESDFMMDEIEIEIKGKICDETDSPLDNASISFSIGGSTIDLVSDKDGSFSFTVGQQFLNQTIGYEVNKEGFKIKSGKLKLIEDLRCINLSELIPDPIPDPNRWIKVAAIGITLAAIAIILILIMTPELSTNPDPIDFDFVPGTGAQTFSIWNDGYRTLEWYVSSDQDWIIVSPDSGTESGTVSVNVNSAGMDPRRHTGIITVTSNGGTETGRISLYIPIEPANETTLDAPVIHDFNAVPKHIDGLEGETRLSWNVSGATSVTIDGISVDVSAGSIHRGIGENTLFTLIATNDDGVSDIKDTYVYVGEIPPDLPIIDSFYADPFDISVGNKSTLFWKVSGATSVTIDGKEVKNPVRGEKDVYPNETFTYKLEATNEAGKASSTIIVTVKEPEEFEVGPGSEGIGEEAQPKLYVDPDQLNFGTISKEDEKSQRFVVSNDEGGTLNWRVHDNPDWIDISPTSGSSVPVTITVTANTAKLDAGEDYDGNIVIDSNGGTETVRVSMSVEEPTLEPPVIHDFNAVPNHIDGLEGETRLSWNVSGATSVTIDGFGPVKISEGSIDTWVEQTTTFILRATNEDGVSDVRTTIVYIEGEPVDKPVIYYFIATPDSISAGEKSTLKWDVSGVETVTINNEIGENDGTGYTDVLLDETTTFILTAENDAGKAVETVEVEVLEPELFVDPGQFPLDFELSTFSRPGSKIETFTISNSGEGNLHWSIKEYYDKIMYEQRWITVDPEEGVLKANNEEIITITINTAVLYSGDYQGGIFIGSNGGTFNGDINLYLRKYNLENIKHSSSLDKHL